uniref:Uncharacterized protein n=1 Tax=Sphaerodactylus townsendi TaxID=933632 RepID=A0ACB8FZ94_9SAUR
MESFQELKADPLAELPKYQEDNRPPYLLLRERESHQWVLSILGVNIMILGEDVTTACYSAENLRPHQAVEPSLHSTVEHMFCSDWQWLFTTSRLKIFPA